MKTCASRSLSVAQDRLAEKEFFGGLGLGTAPFHRVDSLEQLRDGYEQLGGPAILKSRRLGYDGKGQARIDAADDIEAAWAELGGAALLLEGRVEFVRELSVLIARSTTGETAIWPLSENRRIGPRSRSARPPVPSSPNWASSVLTCAS